MLCEDECRGVRRTAELETKSVREFVVIWNYDVQGVVYIVELSTEYERGAVVVW